MKNQYFGDVNDYRKYGLLRHLQRVGFRKLLVAWMLTPDDGGPDGRFRSYLSSSDRWADLDSELYEGLHTLLPSGQPPAVGLIENTGLLPAAAFYSPLVPDAKAERVAWREGVLAASLGVDLVFVDPDNGIEVPSKPIGRKGSSKYVAWAELEAIWRAGCSVLVYQHFPRQPRVAFALRIAAELRRRTGAQHVEGFRTPNVLFLFAAQARHKHLFTQACSGVAPQWAGQVVPIGLADRPRRAAAR